MKKFIPTYLYVKTHNITGLKYFGKTTGDPFKYRGSGIYWLRHLKEHGYDVRTDVIGYYMLQEECMSTATQFSKDNDIVNAVNENNKKIWANQIIENGIAWSLLLGKKLARFMWKYSLNARYKIR